MKLIKAPCGLHCIKVNGLKVHFGEEEVLNDINMHIHCGTLTVLIGKNGAGKSTLMRALLNDVPHSGTVEFKDRENGNIRKMTIGYVPQKMNIEKNTPVSVYDMMASYESNVPVFFRKSAKLKAIIEEALEVFNAKELIDKKMCNLSGGEMQRVLLSLAIMNRPNLLLLDEPVSGVDAQGEKNFYRIIDELKRNYDMAIILISHDLDLVMKYADNVVLLDHTILKQGSPYSVFTSDEFKSAFPGYELMTGGNKDE
ncbi:MAG: metal ABC transporter ATP-binding protein [Lachnospiraceae bacterium]|nr:metal ABC transporter ATP-binding protein [Lachnospiraceae bacterium]